MTTICTVTQGTYSNFYEDAYFIILYFFRLKMPRNYKRKSERATKYSQQDLEIAIEKVKNKELTNYAASKIYNIPPSTLKDRVFAKKGLRSYTMGRPPALPMKAETRLANCLRTLEKWGFGLSREEVIDVTTDFIKKKKQIKTPIQE